MVRLPVDFRHRQTKRNLPPRALSAKVQQMPLLWQTLGGNTLPPRSADLHLRIATDGKDRCVSCQARQTSFNPCLSGFLVCALRWCLRSCALYIDNGGCSPRAMTMRSLPRRARLQRVNRSGKGLCQITLRSFAWSHAAAFLPTPVKIVLLSSWPSPRVVAMAGLHAMCVAATFVIHWIHVSTFLSQQNV